MGDKFRVKSRQKDMNFSFHKGTALSVLVCRSVSAVGERSLAGSWIASRMASPKAFTPEEVAYE